MKIKDLTYDRDSAVTTMLGGYLPERATKVLEFENLSINEQEIYDEMHKSARYLISDCAPMIVGPKVMNATIAS